ncbi:hypothetical protein [Actinomyces viscosus]|uniref:hypothetical protein n=1 Tax=Actinomyces viscosus TaxID=1656 RepID=UPI001FD6AE5F|nr:hypothetical protein [Actinomyces viscosus]
MAGAISGGLTVASVIVRMVHDLVRDAIADVIGKVASKVAIGVLTAGLAAPWAVASVIADVSSWVTRLSKEVADVVLSARNLKTLLDKAVKLFGDVGEKFAGLVAMLMGRGSKKADDAVEAAEDAVDAATDGTKSAGNAADAATDGPKSGKNADKYKKDIPELFRQHQAQKAAKQQARERLSEAIPEGYSLKDFSRKEMSKTGRKLQAEGRSQREIDNLTEMADEASKAHKNLNDAAARIGEPGGEAHLTENGYHIPDEFRADNVTVNNGTAPRGWVDGMALSPNGDEMVVAEYKGVSAQVDSTPRVTTYEGKAPQASPAYTRDRMLSDPRFAQYFHDHPDVWQSVQNGDTKMTIKVIATREPGRIEVTDTPFELTPEVTQHLQESIDKL